MNKLKNSGIKLAVLFTFLLATLNINAQNALNFDGTNDYLITNYKGISGTGARTFEAWVKIPKTTSPLDGAIVAYGENLASKKFVFRIQSSASGTNGALRAEVNGGYIIGSTDLRDDQWHHVAMTWTNDGTPNITDGKLYVDGVLEKISGSLPWALNTSSSGKKVVIGNSWFGTPQYFEGSIDEIRIWSKANSAAEIVNNMNNEFCSFPTDLKLYLKLNEGTANGSNTTVKTAKDELGIGNGTLSGFSLSGTSSNWVTGASITSSNPVTYTQTIKECLGYTLTVGSSSYSSTGVYTDIFTGAAVNGCDSVVTTDLTIIRPYEYTQAFSECDGFSIEVNKKVYNSTGIYRDTLTGVISGCDSIINTNLIINQHYDIDTTIQACEGYEFILGTSVHTTTGTYSAELLSIHGCDSSVTVHLTITPFVYSASIDGSFLKATNPNAFYQWIDCDNDNSVIQGATTQTYIPTSIGTYAVITTEGSCSDTSDCITFNLGIEENDISMQANIYPNPTDGQVNIELFDSKSTTIIITDNLGKEIKRIVTNTSIITIDLSHLEKGMYHFIILTPLGKTVNSITLQ